jgi:hypothetical protein
MEPRWSSTPFAGHAAKCNESKNANSSSCPRHPVADDRHEQRLRFSALGEYQRIFGCLTRGAHKSQNARASALEDWGRRFPENDFHRRCVSRRENCKLSTRAHRHSLSIGSINSHVTDDLPPCVPGSKLKLLKTEIE